MGEAFWPFGAGGTGSNPGMGEGSEENGDAEAPAGVTGAVPLALEEVGSPARHIEDTIAPMSKPSSAVLAIIFIDRPDLATWRPCTGYAGDSSYSERFGKIGRAS
jgi:hypothetical protein